MIIQAGQSGRGRRFAARWGELIFATATSVASGTERYAALKAEAAAQGRDPDALVVCMLITTVVGESKTEAEDKMDLLKDLVLEVDRLSLLAEGLNIDFADKDLDADMTDEEIAGISGFQGMRDQVMEDSGKTNPSINDFLKHNYRGRPDDALCGTPAEIADQLQEMFEAPACDGFVVAATHIPGAYDDFVRLVVPELQRRGLYHDEYTGATLRENLGLPYPALGNWKQ